MDCCQPKNTIGICNTDCCGYVGKTQIDGRNKIIIDFLFLDLNICTRCQGTDTSLEEAIADVAKVLQLTGTEVVVNKIHINSKVKAIRYKFIKHLLLYE